MKLIFLGLFGCCLLHSICGVNLEASSNSLATPYSNSSSYDREGRRFGIFPMLAYVKVGQAICQSETKESGVCMKKSACTAAVGRDIGSCATNFGTCCAVKKPCAATTQTVTLNGTRLTKGSTFNEYCNYEIPRQTGVCQIRLDFTQFQIAEDAEKTKLFGTCPVDSMTISPQVGFNMGDLCGDLTGQHMYLEYGSGDRINVNINLMMDMDQTWDILVTMIKCDSPERAPIGCLQYFTENKYTVKSFNFGQGGNMKGHQLNNQDYSVCVRTNPGMKSITWKACDPVETSFQVSGDSGTDPPTPVSPSLGQLMGDECTPTPTEPKVGDWVTFFGENKYCGIAFPEMVSTSAQPFMMRVHFDGMELVLPPPPPTDPNEPIPPTPAIDYENAGFCLKYVQTPQQL